MKSADRPVGAEDEEHEVAWSVNDIPDQSGKIAVITGANSGLGYEASRELARKGATVIMAVRNMEKGANAIARIRADVPDAKLQLRDVDLGSLDSVRAFADRVKSEHERVDLLLNNAGLMATPAGETKDGFETQIGTNHFGHFVLTEELMAVLEAAPAARVVTVTSGARLQGRTLTEDRTQVTDDYDPWRAYGDSKLANYQFAIELARRLEAAASSVASLVAHPGLSHTNLQVATAASGGTGVSGRFWKIAARYTGMSALGGALPVLRAATDPDAANGEFYGPRWSMRGAPVRLGSDEKRAAKDETTRMWDITESRTGTVFSLGN